MAWYDKMAAVALGRLYWSEEQLLRSDVNAILVGYAEHMVMLKSIFGSDDPPPRGGKPPKITPKAFDALLGGAAPKRRRR